MVLLEWALAVTRVKRASLETEVSRLRNSAGKRADSIWAMHKDELVEVAYRELGPVLNRDRDWFQKQTVIELRERIREMRENVKKETEVDAFMTIPQGLDRMKKEELQQECLMRSINVTEPVTRAKMIVAIKDDVEERRLNSQWQDPTSQMETDSNAWTALNSSSSRSFTSGRTPQRR